MRQLFGKLFLRKTRALSKPLDDVRAERRSELPRRYRLIWSVPNPGIGYIGQAALLQFVQQSPQPAEQAAGTVKHQGLSDVTAWNGGSDRIFEASHCFSPVWLAGRRVTLDGGPDRVVDQQHDHGASYCDEQAVQIETCPCSKLRSGGKA
jgi:hypothetical protein